MTTRRAWLEAVHLLALAAWLAMLATAAIGASIIFPAMREAKASAPNYPAYPAEMWRLVGGLAASPIFFFTAKVQAWCGLVAVFSFLGVLASGLTPKSFVGAARLLTLLVASGTLAYYTHGYMPRMHEQFHALRDASTDAARTEEAAAVQRRFDDAHRLGSPLISTMGVAMMVALVLVPISMRRVGACACGRATKCESDHVA